MKNLATEAQVAARAPSDGSAWVQGAEARPRVVRGGSWYNTSMSLRSAHRSWFTNNERGTTRGFRVGRDAYPLSPCVLGQGAKY